MQNVIWELKEAKKEIEAGHVPEDILQLLDSAISSLENLTSLKHVKFRFEDEELSLDEVLHRYKMYHYGKDDKRKQEKE